MFKVLDNGAPKMHFRCAQRCVFARLCTFPHQVCIYRDMQYLKFGLVFDLNFFHKLDLYQVNKTLLNLIFIAQLTFSLFFLHYLFPLFTTFFSFEGIAIWFILVQKLFGVPSLFWDLGGHRTLLHTMNSSKKC